MQATMTFVVERLTKNKVRYAEVLGEGQEPVLETAYILKWFLSDPPPERITIIISDGVEA